MSYGTSDATVISSVKTGAQNLNPTCASAAQRGGSSPATIPTNSQENRQQVSCGGLLTYGGGLVNIEGMSLDVVVK